MAISSFHSVFEPLWFTQNTFSSFPLQSQELEASFFIVPVEEETLMHLVEVSGSTSITRVVITIIKAGMLSVNYS